MNPHSKTTNSMFNNAAHDTISKRAKHAANDAASNTTDGTSISAHVPASGTSSCDLLANLDQLHTTELGVVRIKRNLSLDTDDVVAWCHEKILSSDAAITRNGKNWYIAIADCIITVNAYSYTIITAHRVKH